VEGSYALRHIGVIKIKVIVVLEKHLAMDIQRGFQKELYNKLFLKHPILPVRAALNLNYPR
jgi:hypothetical protein